MATTTPPHNRNVPVTPRDTRARTRGLRDDINEIRDARSVKGINEMLSYGAGKGKKWYPQRLSEDKDELVKQLKVICILGRPGDGLMVDTPTLIGLAESMLADDAESKGWRGLAFYAFAAPCKKCDKCTPTCMSYTGTMFAAWGHLRDGVKLPDDTVWDDIYDLITLTVEWCHEHLEPVEFH